MLFRGVLFQSKHNNPELGGFHGFWHEVVCPHLTKSG